MGFKIVSNLHVWTSPRALASAWFFWVIRIASVRFTGSCCRLWNIGFCYWRRCRCLICITSICIAIFLLFSYFNMWAASLRKRKNQSIMTIFEFTVLTEEKITVYLIKTIFHWQFFWDIMQCFNIWLRNSVIITLANKTQNACILIYTRISTVSAAPPAEMLSKSSSTRRTSSGCKMKENHNNQQVQFWTFRKWIRFSNEKS